MRIALIHNQYRLRGGTETYLFDLVKGFIQAGDQVDVIVYKQDKNADILSGVKVHKYNIPMFPHRMRQYFFSRLLRKKFNPAKYDLAISVTRTPYQDIAICGGTHRCYLQKIGKTPNVFDRLEFKLEQNCFNNSKMIIAHSKLIQTEIQNLYGINSNKIQLVYPPIDTQKFNTELLADKEFYREKYGLSKNKKVLLFPSTGHKRKGLFVLLEALNKLPKNQFELAVAGTPTSIDEESDNIKFLGFIPHMAELYKAADYTILPSFYEPFGLVVAESLQVGTPVIISNQVGAKNLISSQEGVICEDVTAEAVHKAILQAVDTQFNIEANCFAQSKNLTIDKHILQIKEMNCRS